MMRHSKTMFAVQSWPIKAECGQSQSQMNRGLWMWLGRNVLLKLIVFLCPPVGVVIWWCSVHPYYWWILDGMHLKVCPSMYFLWYGLRSNIVLYRWVRTLTYWYQFIYLINIVYKLNGMFLHCRYTLKIIMYPWWRNVLVFISKHVGCPSFSLFLRWMTVLYDYQFTLAVYIVCSNHIVVHVLTFVHLYFLCI